MESSEDCSDASRPEKRHKGDKTWRPTKTSSERDAGKDLLSALLKLYSSCRLAASDVCELCALCHAAGVRGAAFDVYGYRGQNAQRHLDSVFPHSGEMLEVRVPVHRKKGLVRSVELFEVRALWSSLEYEVAESPCLLDVFEVPAKDRQPSIVDLPAYTSHPLVKEHVKQGLAMPIPVSVYLDSVAFITQAAGRSESVLGIWVINELSQKRHLLATLKGGDQCRCGCRGDCSIFPLLENLRWQLASLQRGHLEVVKR